MPPALLRMQRPATGRRETECVERAAPMVSEQELIERIRRGDLVSFKAVFERYYGGVHAFTRGVVDNGFHAEEITQNVFIRLWLKREALDPSRNFKAFLYTLARHEIADYFRSDRYDRRGSGSTCSTTRNMCRSSSPRPTMPTGCGSWCWTRSTGCRPAAGGFPAEPHRGADER